MLAQGREVQTHRASGVRDEEPIVFVVDDDLSMREALEALIEAAGRRVLTFASGEEFLGHIQERRPSCLLLDYTLPDLNGLQIQQRIAAERPDMSIIFVTGNGSVPITVKAMRAGAVEFLTKPFKSDELLRAIEVALQRSQAELRQAARARVFEARFTSLSGRERQVMGLVLRVLRRPPLERRPTAGGIAKAAAWTVAGWLLWGTQAWLLLRDVTGQGLGVLLVSVGAYALAWSAGTIAVVFPGGIGPRELALIAALAPVAARGPALVVAVLSRVLMTGSDLAWGSAGLLIGRRLTRALAARKAAALAGAPDSCAAAE